VLIDIGSTTTDLVRFGGGRVQYRGYTDGERLRSEELVYTGAIRTPIMAVAAGAAHASNLTYRQPVDAALLRFEHPVKVAA
jgi:uncharacterized hydantoinase/oxoprolinase family protein